MEKRKITEQLNTRLTTLQIHIINQVPVSDGIKKLVHTTDRLAETLKNNFINTYDNTEIIDELLYLVKALKHFWGIKRSIDPRIEQQNDPNKWLIDEIERIKSELYNLQNGYIQK